VEKTKFKKYNKILDDLEMNMKHTEMLSKLDSEINKFGKTTENLKCDIKTVEALSDDFILPLRIKGKMLGVGRFKKKYYTEEELKKAAEKYRGITIPLKLDHKIRESCATIGRVNRIFWSDSEKVLRYEAHINNATHARNVIDGVDKEVSVSIESFDGFDPRYGHIGYDMDLPELSIVWKGSYHGNTLEVDK